MNDEKHYQEQGHHNVSLRQHHHGPQQGDDMDLDDTNHPYPKRA